MPANSLFTRTKVTEKTETERYDFNDETVVFDALA